MSAVINLLLRHQKKWSFFSQTRLLVLFCWWGSRKGIKQLITYVQSLCLKLLGIHPSHLNCNKWILSLAWVSMLGQHLLCQNTWMVSTISTTQLSLKIDALLYLMKQSVGHVYRKSVSQWVNWNSHDCFILTIKKKDYTNTGQINICEKKVSDLLLIWKQEDLTISWRRKVRKFLFRYERFTYRHDINLSQRSKNENQTKKAQINFLYTTFK